jgi:ABC-2 type transport system permease protein
MVKAIAEEQFGPAMRAATELPFQSQARPLGQAGHFNAYSHSFCGMTLQYLLFWGMESGLLLLRERSRGVWRRLRTAPVPLSRILLAKTLSTAAIAFLLVLSTFSFGAVVFGVRIGGSILGFLVMAAMMSLLAAATGLLVATLGGTEARARSVCILAILGVSMLGGLWLPQFLLPGWARDLALALPTTWAMRGLDTVTWQGGGLLALWPSVLALAAFTAAFWAIARVRFAQADRQFRKGVI